MSDFLEQCKGGFRKGELVCFIARPLCGTPKVNMEMLLKLAENKDE